jgi:DNA-binding transcriptional MerR regulator
MGQYSIQDLAQLSGIKAHTIRIWEKRYAIINPKRTTTNIRYYSDSDLRKILNISILNNSGLKVSKIARLGHEEIARQVSIVSESDLQLSNEKNIDQLIMSMISLDEVMFSKVISEVSDQLGFERAMIEVVYPFMTKIGVLWQTGNINPAQEHFISNLIRQRIIVAIDQLDKTALKIDAPLVLLFLPENELHELGLLFALYLSKKNNYQTIYLGQKMPYKDLLSVRDLYTPDLLITYMINPLKENQSQEYVDQLAADFPKSTILCSMSPANSSGIKLQKNTYLISSALELNKHLAR